MLKACFLWKNKTRVFREKDMLNAIMTTQETHNKNTDKPVIIMNFSGIYREEPFARNNRFVHIDCSQLHGTDCYCDEEGAKSIRKAISSYPATGVHFIDSGDYHYVTKFWTEKINRPFSLVLFDHHTDMQPSRWSGMLSCGGWVKDMADSDSLLMHIYILGVTKEQASTIPDAYADKVRIITDEQLKEHTDVLKPLAIGEPLYISIDKDVLDTNSAKTDWDQGILTLDDLKRTLSLMLKHEQIIGIDVCGECPATLSLFDPDRSVEIDDKANSELLTLFKQQELC